MQAPGLLMHADEKKVNVGQRREIKDNGEACRAQKRLKGSPNPSHPQFNFGLQKRVIRLVNEFPVYFISLKSAPTQCRHKPTSKIPGTPSGPALAEELQRTRAPSEELLKSCTVCSAVSTLGPHGLWWPPGSSSWGFSRRQSEGQRLPS